MSSTVFISPGVYATETDNSQIAVVNTATILAIVTPTSRGETNTATLCTSYDDVVNYFGYAAQAYPGLLVARDFFAAGGTQCYIVRVASGDVAAAFSLPLGNGGSVTIPAATTGTYMNGVSAVIKHNNQAQKTYSTSMSLVLFNQETVTITGSATATDQLQLTFTNAGIAGSPLMVYYPVVSGDTLATMASGLAAVINKNSALAAANITATSAAGVVTISAPTTLGAVTYARNVSGIASETMTLATGATNQPAPQTYAVTLYDTANVGETVTFTGTATVGDVVSVTFTNANISGSPVTVSYTVLTGDNLSTIASALGNLINANASLALAGITCTTSGQVITIEALKSLGTVTYATAVTGSATEIMTLAVVAGNVQNNPIVPGTLSMSINSTACTVTDDSKGNLVFTPTNAGISGSVWSGTINYMTGVMTITVTGIAATSSPALVANFNYFQTFSMQLNYQLLNTTTGSVITSYGLVQFNNLTPLNFQATVSNTTNIGTVAGSTLPAFPKPGTYQFVGGTDGISGLTDASYIGVGGGSSPTGMQIFADADNLNINTFCVPGRGDSIAIRDAAVQLVTDSRNDTILLMAPPFTENTIQGAADWANGVNAYANYGLLDNSFTALYFPNYVTYNATNGAFENTPAEAGAAMAFARSDYYQAPAGYTRGQVPNTTSILPLNQGARDFLQSNRINPISNLQNMGMMVSGQLTAQVASSSLNRVGARKVLSRLEKIVVQTAFPVLFDLDDPTTWQRIQDIITPVVNSMVSKGILRYASVVCDSTTNTSITIANNQVVVEITVMLPKFAEQIVLNFNITETGATSVIQTIVPTAQAA